MATSARDMQELLMTVLDYDEIRNMSTFEDVGLLTTDKGVVLTMRDGAEFQVTIVQSRRSKDDDGLED